MIGSRWSQAVHKIWVWPLSSGALWRARVVLGGRTLRQPGVATKQLGGADVALAVLCK